MALWVSSMPRPWPSSWLTRRFVISVDHLDDGLAVVLVEDDDLVDAVQELGTEVRLQRVHHLVLHPLVAHRRVGRGEADVGLAQVGGAEVATS